MTVHSQKPELSEHVLRGSIGDVHDACVPQIASAKIIARHSDRTVRNVRYGHRARPRHRVPSGTSLPVQPPLAAIDRDGCSPDTPADTIARVLYRFSRLRHVDHEQTDTGFDPFCDVGSKIDSTVDLMTQPLNIQFRAEQITCLVFNTDDQCTTAGRVGHGRDLVGELVSGLRVLTVTGQQAAARAPPARFFLDVDTLSLSLVGQHAAADIRETLFDGNLGSSPVCDQFSAGLKGNRIARLRHDFQFTPPAKPKVLRIGRDPRCICAPAVAIQFQPGT